MRSAAGTTLHSIPPISSESSVIASGRSDASFRATVVLPAPNAPLSRLPVSSALVAVCYCIGQ